MEFIVDCINISLSSFPPIPQFTHSSVHLSFLSLFIHLSVHPLTCPPVRSSIQPFICLSFCQSLCSTRRLSICSSIHLSIRWPVVVVSILSFVFSCIHCSVRLSGSLSVFLFVRSSIHPFVCSSIYSSV